MNKVTGIPAILTKEKGADHNGNRVGTLLGIHAMQQ